MAGIGAAVSTPHFLATAAASGVITGGGNAADAMIAANAVLGVVAPETCGVGGDMFALVWKPGMDSPEAINASGPAGSGASADSLRRAGHVRMPEMGVQTVTVPGCVGGWESLNRRHGSMPLAELLTPAIELAEKGFDASPELAAAFNARCEALSRQEAARGLYPEQRPPTSGETLMRPGLALTLRSIAAGGADAFYGGDPGRAIVTATRGNLSGSDLVGFRPEWVDPIRMDLLGRTGWVVPPNSQGYLTLATLAIFEALDPDPDDPAWTHLLIESYRTASASRDDVLADPAFLPSGFAEMTDLHHLRDLAAGIDANHAGEPPAPGPAPGGTAYLCAVDGDGMGVSFIESNFWGIGSNIGAAGFFLHNRGAGFNLTPGHPNELAPGKRPLHTLAPSLWTRHGRLDAVLGTRGGHRQPQIMAQVAAMVFGGGSDVRQAQEAVRWSIDPPGIRSDLSVLIESRAQDALVADLRARGHDVEVGDPYEPGWGPVSMIAVTEEGEVSTHPDPRVSTTSVWIA